MNSLLSYWRPLSVITRRGHPKRRAIRSLKALVTAGAVACRSGCISTHLLNLSCITASMVNPFADRGSGPTKSTATTSQGLAAGVVCIPPAGACCSALYSRHFWQRLTYLFASRTIPGQK